ncbi:hypothetical protein ACB094_11G191400 [Castanea mollissima]
MVSIYLSDKIVESWLGKNRMVETETETEKSQNPWMDGQDSAVESRVEEVGLGSTATQSSTLGFGERAVSAASAAFLSAIIVNPLDVVKTRLQAQAAGVAYSHPLSNIMNRMAYFGPKTVKRIVNPLPIMSMMKEYTGITSLLN